MTRRDARRAALGVLFAYGYTPEKTAEELDGERIKEFDGEEDGYISSAVKGVLSHTEEIDAMIAECAVGWSVSRISRVSMAILRLAGYEMLYMQDIPLRVTLNEAIELSKEFDEEKAFLFVNGVLNRMAQDERVVSLGHR